MAFTPNQHKDLLVLLQGSSPFQFHSVNHLTSKSKLGIDITCTIPNIPRFQTFILDTGVTDHVSYTIIFSVLKRINPITTKLPNGSLVTTCYAETIRFDHSFYIKYVLDFPNFAFKLIYVHKLTQTL